MASFIRRGDKWRVQVKKNGERYTSTWDTKAEAKAWAVAKEAELNTDDRGTGGSKLLRELFERYAREVSPRHKGARWEQIRLEKLARDIGQHKLKDVVETDVLSVWKTQRLTQVKPGSVIREMTLLNQVFETALHEWRVIGRNPMVGVRKPSAPRARTRLIASDELAAMYSALGYTEHNPIVAKMPQVGLALAIALQTAMRASEVLSLTRQEGKVAVLHDTKNGDVRRVPLSPEARRLVQRIPEGGFTLSSGELSSLFRKARLKCGFPSGEQGGFTFHDSRANALTMLSKKLDVLELAKMVGHRDPRSLMIYYRESAEDIADRL
jgi:integrase